MPLVPRATRAQRCDSQDAVSNRLVAPPGETVFHLLVRWQPRGFDRVLPVPQYRTGPMRSGQTNAETNRRERRAEKRRPPCVGGQFAPRSSWPAQSIVRAQFNSINALLFFISPPSRLLNSEKHEVDGRFKRLQASRSARRRCAARGPGPGRRGNCAFNIRRGGALHATRASPLSTHLASVRHVANPRGRPPLAVLQRRLNSPKFGQALQMYTAAYPACQF